MNSVPLNGSTSRVFHSPINQRGNGIAQSAGETMKKPWTKVLKRQKRREERGSEGSHVLKGLFVFYIIGLLSENVLG